MNLTAFTTTGKKVQQPHLMAIAVLFVFALCASLVLAGGTRLHAESLQLDWSYFLPFGVWLFLTLVCNQSLRKHLPNRDPWVFPCVMLLCGWGLLMIWRLSPSLGLRQTLWFVFACGLFLFGLRVKALIPNLKRYKYLWLVLGLVLIGLTFFVGVNPNGVGARLWLKVFGFYIQPSEPLKLLMVVYLAGFFAAQLRPNASLLGSIFPTLIVTGLAALLLLAQRDLGTAALFILLYALMLTVTTQHKGFLVAIPLAGALAGVVGYYTIDVVKTRIDIWLHPWLEAGGSAYQLVQAQIAMAAGGISGSGAGLGSPGFVPVAVSDFMFTAIAEELGLLGTVALMLILLTLIVRGFCIAQASKTVFGRYLAFGLSACLAVQSLFIIGGNLGLLPLTGVTLPYLSYGGSSLVTNILASLLLLRVSSESAPELLPEKTRRPYGWITRVTLVLFVLLCFWNSIYAVFLQKDLVGRAENPRWAVDDRFSPRGNIYTLKDEPLVLTVGERGSYERDVKVAELSQTLGYAEGLYGQAGLERSLYPLLRGHQGVDEGAFLKHELLYNQPPAGADLRVNINLAMQSRADKMLGGNRGAIVLLNPSSGEVYALSSHPGYDANQLTEQWEALMADSKAPLLNRATQGAYPLGTLSNVFALNSYWGQSQATDLPTLSHRMDPLCQQAARRSATDTSVLQYGCERASQNLIDEIGIPAVLDEMERWGLYRAPHIELEVALPPEKPSQQGSAGFDLRETLVSPLQMALVASTISNAGQQHAPVLVNSYLDSAGQWQAYALPEAPRTVIPEGRAQAFAGLYASDSQSIWFQMAHARNQDGSPLTWYIGGTTAQWQGTPLAIAIVVEDNRPELVQRIGATLLNYDSGR